MKRPKRIGIVAVSAEGAALCYRTLCFEGAALLGAHDHPEIIMHTYSLAEYMRCIEGNQWEEVGRLLLSSANKLVEGGAELLVSRTIPSIKRSTLSVTSCRYHGCILLKRSQRLQ